MKVILLENVANLGKKYELHEVKPGFARNYLFARGLAEAVTKANAKRVAEMSNKREIEKTRQAELLAKALEKVGDAKVSFTRKANEEGHLYAGITKDELAETLGNAIGAVVPADHIELDRPLKTLGEHKVTMTLGEKSAVFSVEVVAE